MTAAAADIRPKISLSDYAKLDEKQVGHLRHFHNLVSQPDGNWRYMEHEDGHEEFDDAKRYQLALMAYAAGVAHFHRLPALRGAFRNLMRKIIHKMLRREVWSYWYSASHSGKVFDPDLTELRKPWADPVRKENIMYSGHLLLMTSLYAMLFDDDEFEREGSIVFRWDPVFWGLGPETYVYDNRSLAKVILSQMEENEWVGVCCEPNAVFVVCNQFPLIAMRLNDSRDGTDHVERQILPKYKAALSAKGMLGRSDGLYASYFAVKQKCAMPAKQGAHTAWANAFMNTWNADYVQASYEAQTLGFLTHFDGNTRIQPTCVAKAFRTLVHERGYDPDDQATLHAAREIAQDYQPKIPFETLNWLGYTMMLSELGKEKELRSLLESADTHLEPTWVDGGFFYPRNSQLMDENWNYTHVEPHSGNSGIGYARLNVVDGQKKIWEKPWTKDLLSSRPYIDGDGFEDDLDFTRAICDVERAAVILTARRWRGHPRESTFYVNNLAPGRWALFVNGRLAKSELLNSKGQMQIVVTVSMDETDIIVEQIEPQEARS
ncbi:hypothetical protein FA10DRAFT_256634 [Acaromyces ingoldii]|uniref:Linalool dehydratase/isomerase domain-containing protein n=1 Tax=Acaromyces ingoldii TaxID=215250 RepID=A0A316YDM3_9BASI|nr:hypothetical protein FA10DRAFT_256634 [Acaromyces ingoldii]PWN86758.1 hypothetical protein FA10DRAFT_256634 [Acaromyces ingoldii]